LWPDLRAEIGSGIRPFADDDLLRIICEVCSSEDSVTELEAMMLTRLSDDQRARLSEFMVGPLMADDAKKRTLMQDYLTALADKQRSDQLRELRRVAAASDADENGAAAAAQEMILLRRQGNLR
jgi:hypothetical protein